MALIAFVGLMIGLGFWSVSQSRSTLDELSEVISDAYVADLAFEREIGFGGLIHNFKNAVLRSNEPGYREAARENVRRALKLTEDLQRAGESLGLKADWTGARLPPLLPEGRCREPDQRDEEGSLH